MNNNYNYIIVGAGTAGCVLANRLGRNPDHRVLILESGPSDRSLMIDMPRGVGKVLAPESKYISIYQANKGANLGDEAWIKGNTVGGSSSINGMIYSRGHPQDFNQWAKIGCTGWGWDDIGSCYAALESHELGPEDYRGGSGPLKVTIQKPDAAGRRLGDAILQAAKSMGTQTVPDINNSYAGGFGYQPRTIHAGVRQGAGRAFLQPAVKRGNVEVRTDVSVRKVLFDGNRACGVRVKDRTGEYDILTDGEVILSAGAIETPKLLQLSGIGDEQVLKPLGIPVIAHSPEVGRNMQEHYYIQVKYRVKEGSVNPKLLGLPLYLNTFRYLMSKKGVMADAAHDLSGFVKINPDAERPDAHIGVALFLMIFNSKGFAIDPQQGITFSAYKMRPENRGEIIIQSSDADQPPKISANFLSSSNDQKDIIELIRYIRKMASQAPLQSLLTGELAPGPAIETDEEILKFAQEHGSRGFHVSSTCRMGADSCSVVDPTLKVRGTTGLRVVDTSIFPTLTSGNTAAPAMACALRASQIILGKKYNTGW